MQKLTSWWNTVFLYIFQSLSVSKEWSSIRWIKQSTILRMSWLSDSEKHPCSFLLLMGFQGPPDSFYHTFDEILRVFLLPEPSLGPWCSEGNTVLPNLDQFKWFLNPHSPVWAQASLLTAWSTRVLLCITAPTICVPSKQKRTRSN